MNDKDIEQRMYEMMKYAVEGEREADETLDELKAAAFEVLLLNPGCDRGDWEQTLVEDYGTEVVDAYGNNPREVFALLDDLWESPYYDKASGLEKDYKEWAEAFATEQAVDVYYELIDLKKRI